LIVFSNKLVLCHCSKCRSYPAAMQWPFEFTLCASAIHILSPRATHRHVS
jgi:hypothetical protein